jgi:hypothetical protein
MMLNMLTDLMSRCHDVYFYYIQSSSDCNVGGQGVFPQFFHQHNFFETENNSSPQVARETFDVDAEAAGLAFQTGHTSHSKI